MALAQTVNKPMYLNFIAISMAMNESIHGKLFRV